MKKVSNMDVAEVLVLAETLQKSGMLPRDIDTPQKAFAVIVAGSELGLEPMQSLRSLQVVKGKVVESADSQLGRFKAAGGRCVFTTLTDDSGVAEFTHPNGSDTHTESFSMEDAKRAGLGGNVWKSYPRAMLRSRVITAGLKSVGFLGGAGVYTPEEASGFLDDVRQDAPAEATERPDPTVGMSRPQRKAQAQAPEDQPAPEASRKAFFAKAMKQGWTVEGLKHAITEVTQEAVKASNSALLTVGDLGKVEAYVQENGPEPKEAPEEAPEAPKEAPQEEPVGPIEDDNGNLF